MELTPEEKQRIDEEERRRLAEEQYRAEVRAKLRGPGSGTEARKPRNTWAYSVVVFILLALLVVLAKRVYDQYRETAATTDRPAPPARAPVASVPVRTMSPSEIFDANSGSVVLLENYNEDNQLVATGSGFCVGDSLIATNYHVIRGATRLVAKGKDSTSH
jgi:S1-C subfamily serine protease